jgi:thioredoxin-dependent peroxiredoxin
LHVVSNYRKWLKDVEELQSARVSFPLLADPDCRVLTKLGVTREQPWNGEVVPHCLGLFLIDIDKRIRMSSRYSSTTGRNFYEVLRCYDAVALTTYHRVVCPSNWAIGQEVMLNNEMQPEEAAQYRFVEIKPWFKLTPCPED